jgi:hypothetical protein
LVVALKIESRLRVRGKRCLSTSGVARALVWMMFEERCLQLSSLYRDGAREPRNAIENLRYEGKEASMCGELSAFGRQVHSTSSCPVQHNERATPRICRHGPVDRREPPQTRSLIDILQSASAPSTADQERKARRAGASGKTALLVLWTRGFEQYALENKSAPTLFSRIRSRRKQENM